MSASSMYKREWVQDSEKELLKKKKLSDNKTIGGKGRLTAAAVENISGLYGKCIRDHPTSVNDMHDAIWALFYHKKSTDAEPNHLFCDIKWCKYLQAAAKGMGHTYKHHGM